jgi:hypothetical protein
MATDAFPQEVAEKLGWYVYRLIDPRNGETFYVGKGRGNRVFQHILEAVDFGGEEDALALKIQRIKVIKAAGLDINHVIHRHNIESEEIAYQIEAAVIDAYPGLTNKVAGHDSGDYGSRHVDQLIAEYRAIEFEAQEPLLLISIGVTFDDENLSVYEAVRAAWRLDITRASKVGLVLAHRRGIVVGASRPTVWHPATKELFPRFEIDLAGRFGFEGTVATDVAELYLNKRVPNIYRRKGAANPVRFIGEA